MPTLLPLKLRTRGPVRTRAYDRRVLGVWAIFVGFAALSVATMAYATTGDRVGAAGILTAAAIIIALLSRSADGGPEH